MVGKTKLVFVMALLTAVLFSACAGISDSQVDIDAVQDRLKQIDDYKKSVPDQELKPYSTSDGTFRGFEFGTSMEMVGAIETLPLSGQFADALDYTGSALYGYEMLLTYWFNDDGQFFRASYSMQNDQYLNTLDSLMMGLRGDYGEPYLSGYYDSADTAVTFDTEEEALRGVDNDGAYYYAAFTDVFGKQIELYAHKIETGYDYWVYYTDYAYYNG